MTASYIRTQTFSGFTRIGALVLANLSGKDPAVLLSQPGMAFCRSGLYWAACVPIVAPRPHTIALRRGPAFASCSRAARGSAHTEAHGAQSDRVHTQLERLDARVATLAKRAVRGSPLTVFEPTASARALTLIDLPTEELHRVATFLDPDDKLSAAFACRKLRDAVLGGEIGAQRRTLKTHCKRPAGCAPSSARQRMLVGRENMLSGICICCCPWDKHT